jgi:hypothetical protein
MASGSSSAKLDRSEEGMMYMHYEDAANVLKVFLEDEHKSALADDWDLQRVLMQALTNRYLSRNMPLSIVEDSVGDDAIFIINNLDTLRPILEAYWRDNG